jgi:RHS repeat-associated protein
VASIDPLTNRTTAVYDAAGRQVASINPLGQRASSVYDRASRPLASIDPLGNRASTLYDAAGRPVATVDARGYRTTSIYDATGALLATVDPLLARTSHVYDAAGRQVRVQNALGAITTTTYFATGWVRATIDPLGGRTSLTYDAAGEQTRVQNALGLVTTSVYDPTGALLATIDPLMRRTTSIYDLSGRIIAVQDANGNHTSTVYDAAGQPVAAINALTYRTTSVYDAAGRRVRLVDANGNRVTFLFDPLARDLGSIDPLARRVTFAYDAAGRRTRKLDPRGNLITYVYDAVGRRITDRYSTGRRNSYVYDPVGNRTRLADQTGVYTTSFDAKSRVTRTVNASGKVITYAYDLADRRTLLTDADGKRSSYLYDAKDRLVGLINGQGKRTSFVFDAIDRQTRQKHGNGGITTQAYDAAGQLVSLYSATSAGLVVNRFTYSYDSAGNRTGVQESSGDRTTWAYDRSYQLLHEKRTGQTAFDVTYTYDPVGNRLTQTDSGARTTYTYDATNEMLVALTAAGRTSYTYDLCGNRTKMNSFAAITDYDWDEDNRIQVIQLPTNPVTLSYSADGLRVQKTTPTVIRNFIYDFEKVLQETDGAGLTTKEYLSTAEQYGNLISAYDGAQTTYYEPDGLGSTDALLNDAETATDRYTYRAFGLATQSGTSSNNYTYVGAQRYYSDPEVSLYFVGKRYYDYLSGRWLSEDSLGYKSGDVNLYRYVGNNPVNATDPSGESSLRRWRELHEWYEQLLDEARTLVALVDELDQLWDYRSGVVDDELRRPDPHNRQAAEALRMRLVRRLAYTDERIREHVRAIEDRIQRLGILDPRQFHNTATQEEWGGAILVLSRSERFRLAASLAQIALDSRSDLQAQLTLDAQTQGEVNDEIAAMRQEFERRAPNLSAEERRRTAPFLYAGPEQFRYFRPEITADAAGERLLRFLPTPELRRLQVQQALMAGLVIFGNSAQPACFTRTRPDELFRLNPDGTVSGPRRAFTPPLTTEAALAWFEVFGTTPPGRLYEGRRTSGGLQNCSGDLAVVVPAGFLMGRISSLGRIGSELLLNATLFTVAEGLARHYGPAGAAGAQVLPILLPLLVRRLPRLGGRGARPAPTTQPGRTPPVAEAVPPGPGATRANLPRPGAAGSGPSGMVSPNRGPGLPPPPAALRMRPGGEGLPNAGAPTGHTSGTPGREPIFDQRLNRGRGGWRDPTTGRVVPALHNQVTFGRLVARDAPHQVQPGVKVLEGVHVDDLGRAHRWRAHYDEFGRLIARTDWDPRGLPGIPPVHHHTYRWGPGMTPLETGSHIPGEFVP